MTLSPIVSGITLMCKDFKTVAEYNHVLHSIFSKLKFCSYQTPLCCFLPVNLFKLDYII